MFATGGAAGGVGVGDAIGLGLGEGLGDGLGLRDGLGVGLVGAECAVVGLLVVVSWASCWLPPLGVVG